MSETNKTYRIRVGETIGNIKNDYVSVSADLVQDYDAFDILSLTIDSTDTYKLHNSNYGVVVGRVIANNGFGIPNAKISVFIQADAGVGTDIRTIYPFSTTVSKDKDGVRYNLLPDEKVSDCHQVVGTFPNKRYALDNDVILEVFDKYYKYTTRTNNAGDYLIMGVPTGAHTLHMDLDLSDCGILSQRPRDFVYKGYTIEQFENPNMFKEGTTYAELSQVFTQDQVVNVQPFWGNSSLGETLGITRADINVAFKFEPTCIFMGSIGSDNASQGISKKCVPTSNMGGMDEMVTGEGTIEMIRKTPAGFVEEFQIKGTQLINSNGVWCYQIPMNLDYMMTDEYGNMVPTDDPEKGIPTRTSVRFRMALQDAEANTNNYFRPKVLVPNNPQNTEDGLHEKYDYEFGSKTQEESFRDLFWNNVYSVKSFIPRFQKRQVSGWKEDKFSGIKHCNYYGANNPLPYNNIRIKLPFMFIIICAIFKSFVFLTGIVNFIISAIGNILADIGNTRFLGRYWFKDMYDRATRLTLNVLRDGICPDLENWYFAPMFTDNRWDAGKVPHGCTKYDILAQTLEMLRTDENGTGKFSDSVKGRDDKTSIDYQNSDKNVKEDAMCLTIKTDYLISCLEMNLAQEYRVINFDFYNDWVNGFIYVPRFMRYIRPKIKFLGITFARAKVKGCMDDTSVFAKSRKYTQQCAIGYKKESINNHSIYTKSNTPNISTGNVVKENNFHKKKGFKQKSIFGGNGGICHEQPTSKKQYVYYLKPCEWITEDSYTNVKVNLFATDIILLGSLNDCDLYGIPQAFKHLTSSSYIMPTNLALTNMDTNGPLYANGENGTICDGKEDKSTSPEYIQTGGGVTVVSVTNSGLTSELGYYSGASSENLVTQYEPQEPSDTIALTEAAGISWDWTGPGQGEADENKMYYPGGHFLGLSCVNSQTNVKSCINLERICEIGATMSQRKEDVSGYDSVNNKLEYTYTVPTGFISGDEIVDTEFRTMFATMNRKRLIATKTNTENGYKTYDFNFLRPSNFDGAFKSIVGNGGPYNTGIKVVDESDKLAQFNILDASKRADYDASEGENTQTRTKETTSFDYYMFRFGHNIDDLKKGSMQERRFLYTDNGYKYLPQYENSYYFYFGMKFGATAIDEFNKEFFSNCETQSLIVGDPTMTVTCDNVKLCEAVGDADVVISNLEMPLESIEWVCSTDTTKSGRESRINPSTADWKKVFDEEWEVFSITGLSFGEYNVSITDANGVVITKPVTVGLDIISYDSVKYDYNTMANTTPIEYRGGYIEVSNIDIKAGTKPNSVVLSLVRTDNGATASTGTYTGDTVMLAGVPVINYNTAEYKLLMQAGTACTPITLSTFKFKHPASINLYAGFRNVLSVNVSDDSYLGTGYETGWWKNQIENNWLFKKCFFLTSQKGQTFNANLFTTSGDKSLWGYAQKINDEGNGVIYFARGFNIPPGYVVDDEAIYEPVVYNKSTENRQYSCVVTNGETLGNNYHGYDDGSGNVTFTDPNEDKYYTGKTPCGYVFKDFETGELEFRILGTGYDTNLTHQYLGHKGIYYPSFIFPIIDRRPKFTNNVFVWSSRHMILGDDSTDGGTIYSDECGFISNIKMVNGITNTDTHNGQFSKNSKIEYWLTNADTSSTLDIEFKYGTGMPNTDAQKNDTYGLDVALQSDNPNVRKYVSAPTYPSTDVSGITTIATTIEEWYPTTITEKDKGKLDLLSITDSVNLGGVFYEDISFKLNKTSTGKVFGPDKEIQGIGTTSGAKYFMCCDDDGSVIKNNNVVVGYFIFNIMGYIGCIYNENAQFENAGASTIAIVMPNDAITYRVSIDGLTKETRTAQGAAGLFNALKNQTSIIGLWPTTTTEGFPIDVNPAYRAQVNIEKLKNNWDIAGTIHSDRVYEGNAYVESRVYYGVGSAETANGVVWKIYPNASPIVEQKEIIPISVSPTDKTAGWMAGNFGLTVTSIMPWTATSDASWAIADTTAGETSMVINVRYEENALITPRTAHITFANAGGSATLTIEQEKAPAFIKLSTTSWAPSSAAGNTTIIVTANTSWSTNVTNGWLTITPTAGVGSLTGESVVVSVEENTGVSRTGTITFTGDTAVTTLTVTQAAGAYTKVTGYPTGTIATASTSYTMTVNSNTNWSLAGAPAWVTLDKTSGTGNDTVKLSVNENTGTTTRSASITVNGSGTKTPSSISFTQEAHAAYYVNVSPTAVTIPAAGTIQSVTVKSNTTWSTGTKPTWLWISKTTGGPNEGGETLQFSAATNTTTGTSSTTITITGTNGGSASISVERQAATAYVKVTGTGSTAGSAATSQSLTVSANTTWTLTSNNSTIANFAGSATKTGGVGSTSVSLAIEENTTTSDRSAKITVTTGAGTATPTDWTITQAAKAYLTVSPTSWNPTSAAQSTNITVSTNCSSWNVSSDSTGWLTVTKGTGQATLNVTENTTTSSRTGTITFTGTGVSNVILTVTQANTLLTPKVNAIYADKA